MSFNTGNPLPSKDILDLYDNSETIDNFVNSQQDETPDRFGTKRLTLAGLIKRSMALRNEINDFSGALTFKPEWTDVPMNVSEGVGGEGGALNLQAEALGNRSEINKVTSREALRRSYAEVGYNLVSGSFEAGGTLVNANDVLLQEFSGKVYGWGGALPKVILTNSDPASDAFIDISDVVGIFADVSTLRSAKLTPGILVRTAEYHSDTNYGGALYEVLTSSEYAGTPDNIGDILLDSGLIAKLVPTDGHVLITQLGVVLDGVTVNKLKPVGAYANKYGIDVIANGRLCIFDDTVNFKNSKLRSDTGFYCKYVGGDIDYKAVISIGYESFDRYGPARFYTSGWDKYEVGELIDFSSGGMGQVLFKQSRYVYFHWFSNNGYAFPPVGALATGVTSGHVGGIGEIRSAVINTPPNVDAGIANVYLTCNLNLDADGIPLSHVKATAFQFHGVSEGGNAHGHIGSIYAQGFENGVIGSGCYSLCIKGPWQFNRCANGILQGEECWTATVFPQITFGSMGAKYGTTRRVMWLNNYTYGVTVEMLNVGVMYGVAQIHGDGTDSFIVQNSDIEFAYSTNVFELNSKLYAYASTAAKATAEGRKLRIKGFSLSGRAVESFIVRIGTGVDSPRIVGLVAGYTGQYIAAPTWRAICDTLNSSDCTDILIQGISSNSVDYGAANPTLKAGVTYHPSCYEERYFTCAPYSPATRNFFIVFDKVSAGSKSIELVSLSTSTDVASPPNAKIYVSDKNANTGNEINVVYDSNLIFYTDEFANKYLVTDAIKIRALQLRTDADAYYSIALKYRFLRFK